MIKSIVCLGILVCITLQLTAADNLYTQHFGYAPIVSAKQAYPDFKSPLPPLISVNGTITIVIASDKQVKVDAVKRLFEQNPRFKDATKLYYPIKSSSNIADQPIGIANGRLGALNRIKYICKHFGCIFDRHVTPSGIYVCAIENYFESKNVVSPRDHAYVMIQSPDFELFEAVSAGVAIQRDVFDIALQYELELETGYPATVGAYLNEKYGFDGSDWFKDVTETRLDRIGQILTTCDEGQWF